MREVHPAEERLAPPVLALDVVARGRRELVVTRLHALSRQRSRVLDSLLPDAAPARVLLRVVFRRRPAAQHAAGAESLAEPFEAVLRRVVRVLRILLGVQVVEVPEELVEAVNGREELVPIAEVVLAELRSGIAVVLEELGDRRVLLLETDGRAGHPDLAQPRAEDALARNEGRPAGGAALLAVRVGQAHSLVRDAVDVRRAVSHQPVAVAAQVRDPDVVAPDHEDVRSVLRYGSPLVVEIPATRARCSGSRGGTSTCRSGPEIARRDDSGDSSSVRAGAIRL